MSFTNPPKPKALQLAEQFQGTVEQQVDNRDDLEQKFRWEFPEQIELLLGVMHVLELGLSDLNGPVDGALGRQARMVHDGLNGRP